MLVNVPGQVALERSYLAQLRGDAEGTAEFATQVLACSGADEWLLSSTARGFLAVAEWLHGRLADAERAFAAGIAGWRAAGQATVAAWGSYQLARVQRARGRLDAAARPASRPCKPPPGPAARPARLGPAYVGLGEVAYQRNELDLALGQVSAGVVLCCQFVYTPPLAAGLVTLAWIRQATGDRAGALAAIEEAGHASPVPPGLSTRSRRSGRGCCWLRVTCAAARWADECGLSADDEPVYAREAGHLLLARVLLAQDRPGRPARCLTG